MSEQTLPAPGALPASADPGRAREGREAASRLLHAYRWPLGARALLLSSTAIVLWAKARPGSDPYGWLVWGHLTIPGRLDTNGAQATRCRGLTLRT